MTTIHDDEPGSRMRELERSLLRAELERDVLAHRKDEPEAVVAGATYAGGSWRR